VTGIGGAESGILDRATKSHVVAEVVFTLRIGQELVHVGLADLEVTGLIATVVRFVALGHCRLPGDYVAIVNGKARAGKSGFMTMSTPLEYGLPPKGYRLPDETHLGAVRLQVSDLERSVRWYKEVLGLDVLARDGESATLAVKGETRALIELREKKGIRPVPRRGLLGLYHYAILLPDRLALGRFIGHLAKLGMHAGMSDHFVSEAVYIDDPDGLGIEIYSDRPRSAWTHENRQLTMASLPLDGRALVAAAGAEPWTGLPSGTVIGHVHLYVGDIDRAAAFYHDLVGFDKVVWSYPGALFMSAGGYHHHLGTNIWAAHAPPASENDAKLIEWEIVVPRATDVAAVEASVKQGGVGADREGSTILLRDPWGTAVRVRPES
jgi:catechol 2,3-dioxygenase